MAEVLGGKGKVMITTIDAAAQWSLDREKGAREGLAAPSRASRSSTRSTPAPTRRKSTRRSRTRCWPIPTITGILSLECCSTPAAGTWVERNEPDRQGQGRRLRSARPDGRPGRRTATSRRPSTRRRKRQGFAAVDLLVQVPARPDDRQCRHRRRRLHQGEHRRSREEVTPGQPAAARAMRRPRLQLRT